MTKNIGYIYAITYIVLLSWVIFAISKITNSDFVIASVFGLSAYCIMWAHYFNGFLKEKFAPESSTKKSYEITRTIVLPSIFLHAFLVNYILFDNGYGLPPSNYNYFGSEKLLIYLGALSLIVFFFFDIKKYLPQKYRNLTEHLSRMAMIIISIHGLMLGYALSHPTNRYVFYFLVATLLLMIGRLYMKEKTKVISIVGSLVIVGSICLLIFFVFKNETKSSKTEATNSQAPTQSDQKTNQQSASEKQTKTVTKSELSINNGKGGNPCWVAVDGTVYNLTTSDKWNNGEHTTTTGVECGKDLSDKIGQSPHGKSTLSKYPIVGSLEVSSD